MTSDPALGDAVLRSVESQLATLPRRRTAVRAAVGRALDFGELADGDALVHVTQGICLFRGIQAHEHNGRNEDFIGLEFAEKAKLHLPVRESHLLSRYIGIGRIQPKLSKLGGGGWERSRKAAEKATADLAAQLLAMQAARSTKPGITHPKVVPYIDAILGRKPIGRRVAILGAGGIGFDVVGGIGIGHRVSLTIGNQAAPAPWPASGRTDSGW